MPSAKAGNNVEMRKKTSSTSQGGSASSKDAKACGLPAKRKSSKIEVAERKEKKVDQTERRRSSRRLSLLNITKCLPKLKTISEIFSPSSNKLGAIATKQPDKSTMAAGEEWDVRTPPQEAPSEMDSEHSSVVSLKQRRRSSKKLANFMRRTSIASTQPSKVEKPLGELAKEKNLNDTQMRTITKLKSDRPSGQPTIKVSNDVLQDRTVKSRLSFDSQLSALGESILNLLNGLIAEADSRRQTDGTQSNERAKEVMKNKQTTGVNSTKCPACKCAVNASSAASDVDRQRKEAGKVVHSEECLLAVKREKRISYSASLGDPTPENSPHASSGRSADNNKNQKLMDPKQKEKTSDSPAGGADKEPTVSTPK